MGNKFRKENRICEQYREALEDFSGMLLIVNGPVCVFLNVAVFGALGFPRASLPNENVEEVSVCAYAVELKKRRTTKRTPLAKHSFPPYIASFEREGCNGQPNLFI